MAQGFQRDLSHDGEVLPLPEPSTRLLVSVHRHNVLLHESPPTGWLAAQRLHAAPATRHHRTLLTAFLLAVANLLHAAGGP
jgi:hypothetical protein